MAGKLAQMDFGEKGDAGLSAGGMAFVGTGIALGITFGIQRRKGFLIWLVPAVLTLIGLGLIATAGVDRYTTHLDDAEQRVRAQFDDLDPFARAKILKDLASEQVPTWMSRKSAKAAE